MPRATLTPDKIERLSEEETALEARLTKIRAEKERSQQELEERREVLVGRTVLALEAAGALEKGWLKAVLAEHLKAKKDRVLFDLDPVTPEPRNAPERSERTAEQRQVTPAQDDDAPLRAE